jgi:Tfp pilus tip-associated adhesin PilY1
MKNRTLSIVLVIAAGAALFPTARVRAEDKDLFSTNVMPPNVFVVLDSGGTTTQDVDNSEHLWACGDDPNSKLYQEKDALRWFLNAFPGFNYGFSYSMKDDPSYLYYLNFLYKVANDGDTLLDGSTLVRMGAQTDPWHNSAVAPQHLIRFGIDGDETAVSYNPGTNGQARVGDPLWVSYLVTDSTGATRKVAGAAPFYYPAYSWNTLATISGGDWVEKGMSGTQTWDQVAPHLGVTPDLTDPTRAWERQLRDQVMARVNASLVQWAATDDGLKTLYIKEDPYRITKVDKSGVPTAWELDTSATSKVTPVVWQQTFVLYDRAIYGDDTQQISASQTLTSFEWKSPGIDCNAGFMKYDNGGSSEDRPIVPFPTPDSSSSQCPVPDNRPLIETYLGPQTTPLFYFPDTNVRFVPQLRANWIPATDTVIAGGRRPLAKLLNDAQVYFQNTVDKTNVCQACRKNFLVILTDGLESCASPSAPCQQAKQMAGSVVDAVFLIGFGSGGLEGQAANQFDCIKNGVGGGSDWQWATDKTELMAAFAKLGQTIIEDTYAYSSPSVPSVELTTKEKGYVSTFMAVNDRSIWEGHLRAYLVDPTTGLIPTTPTTLASGGVIYEPNKSQALWDAADLLANMNDADVASNANANGRRFFFGTDATLGGVPGSRDAFEVSTGALPSSTDTALYNRIFQTSLLAITTTQRDSELAPVVSFIRGYRSDHLVYRYPYDPKSAVATTAAARLGDIFHSVPAIIGRPDCFPCYLTGMTGYSTFLTENNWRRQVLLVGANDGSFHAFDAGFCEPTNTSVNPIVLAQYGTGSGKELWAWVPNEVMPTLDLMTIGSTQQYSVDGSPSLADVYIDPQNGGGIPGSATGPDLSQRKWRTVALVGERKGGDSLICLDITQPDTYTTNATDGTVPVGSSDTFPGCLNGAGNSACGNTNYPSLLWEFRDPGADPTHPDFAESWSKPTVALVHVTSAKGTTPELRTVAILGGGYDPNGTQGGAYLYMIDIETGKTLLKLPTDGGVPAEVGLLDSNLDGFIERVYWTDRNGSIWRMNLVDPSTGNVKAALYDTSASSSTLGQVRCSFTDSNNASCGSASDSSLSWDVQRVFQNPDGGSQPIFQRPAIVLSGFDATGAPEYSIAVGTGDRENIDDKTPGAPLQRFYFFRDPGPGMAAPLTTANLVAITASSATTTTNYLANSDPTMLGWYLTLDEWEKVNTTAVVVNGQVIFSTFTSTAATDVCQRKGFARTYVLNYTNGNPAPGQTSRYATFPPEVVMMSDPIVYVGEDGALHILQSTNDLGLSEPIKAQAVLGSLVSWRER